MYVVKRDGTKAEVRMDKITNRIKQLCGGLNPDYIDPIKVSTKVVAGLYSGVTTRELDALAAEVCAFLGGSSPRTRGEGSRPPSRCAPGSSRPNAPPPPHTPRPPPISQARTPPRTTPTGACWRRASW